MNQKEIEQYLADFEKKEFPLIIRRDLKISQTSKIKVVIGPRRAGKTYFLYGLMKELKKNKKNFLYLNFENTRLFDINFKEIIEIINIHSRLFPKNEKPILFLDEPQIIENWEQSIRELYDDNYDIFITGSSSKLLSQEIATTLRGRSLTYLMLPLSFIEFLRINNVKALRNPSTKEKNELLFFFDKYVKEGSFPEVALEKDSETKLKIIENYFDLVVYKDLVERYKIKDATLMKWFIKSVVSSYSSEISIHKIYLTLKSQGRKISKDDIYEYASMLSDALFAFYLQKFSFSIRKKESITKAYLNDVGFVNLIQTTKDNGKRTENIVFLELLRKKTPQIEYFYYKTAQQGYEVDFVIKKGDKIEQLIQVCYSLDESKEREIRALLKIGEELKCKNLVILTYDYESVEEHSWFGLHAKIKYVPVWKWILEK